MHASNEYIAASKSGDIFDFLIQTRFEICTNLENYNCNNVFTMRDENYSDISSSPKRKRKRKRTSTYVTLFHRISTSLPDVGLQVWRGSFLLADFLLSKIELLKDKVIIELGGGVGLIGVICLLFPHRGAFITDYKDEIIELTKHNISKNLHIDSNFIELRAISNIYTRVINWNDKNNLREIALRGSLTLPYSWKSNDLQLLQSNQIILLAADVIYDDALTDALFQTASEIMKPDEHFWISIEKRFNFTIQDLSLVANGYKKFLQITHSFSIDNHNAKEVNNDQNRIAINDEKVSKFHYNYRNENNEDITCIFKGTRILLDFPQFLIDYDRVPELELWDIEFCILSE